MVGTSEERSEIAFFDVETTVPTRSGQGFAILEFGAILVCPRKLVELRSYSTLVRPADLSHISTLSVRCNGITKDAVVSAPTFADIADDVYQLLQGRIWAGHNILKFDCARIREAFAEVNRPAPEPKGTIDSLALLTQKFGRRAGDMKMATLATYFGLGQQTHRSLDDVRMNLEVLKYCATVLFLKVPEANTGLHGILIIYVSSCCRESSLPDTFTEKSWVSPNAVTRSRSNGKTSVDQASQNVNTPSSSARVEICSASPSDEVEEAHPILSLVMSNTGESSGDLIEPIPARSDPFDMVALGNEMEKDPLPEDNMEEEKSLSSQESSTASNSGGSDGSIGFLSSQESSTASNSGGSNGSIDFLEADTISISSLSVKLVPFYCGSQKIQLLHKNCPLQVSCRCLKLRFGISSRFVDHAGRPRLSFVVHAPPSLCQVLDASDDLAEKLSIDSGSFSEWRPLVNRKPGFYDCPTLRLQLPTVADGDNIRCTTEIYQKDSSATQRLVFSRFDIVELESLFTPGNLVDAYFSLDSYDYQQNAGLRAVAKKLVLHTN